jgi:excisionase family DNA binding protein
LWAIFEKRAEGNVGEEKPQGDEVMDYKELAALLKLAEGTLRHYVMERTIPFVKIGAHVRFLKPEIEKWLLERNYQPVGKQRPKDEPADDGGLLPFEDRE